MTSSAANVLHGFGDASNSTPILEISSAGCTQGVTCGDLSFSQIFSPCPALVARVVRLVAVSAFFTARGGARGPASVPVGIPVVTVTEIKPLFRLSFWNRWQLPAGNSRIVHLLQFPEPVLTVIRSPLC